MIPVYYAHVWVVLNYPCSDCQYNLRNDGGHVAFMPGWTSFYGPSLNHYI